MKDPEQLYRNAYFGILNEVIDLNGRWIPVYSKFVPSTTARPYICISEVTIADGGTGARCQTWDCTILVDIVTEYDNNKLKASDVIGVGAKVLELTQGMNRDLGGVFQFDSHRLELSQTLTEINEANVIDRRLMRFRNKLSEL